MTSKKDIKDSLQNDNCARCGACLSFCPVYEVTLRERFSPRGKNFLLRNFEPSKRDKLVKETVSACLQCGACERLCSANANVASLIREKRNEIGFYRSISPSLFSIWDRLGNKKTGIFLTPLSHLKQGGLKDEIKKIMGKKRFLDSYKKENAYSHKKDSHGTRVALFIGCVQDLIFQKIPQRLLGLLSNEDVFIPEGQGCCGLPAYSQGAFKQARKSAYKNILALEKEEFDYLLTPCASCAYMIKSWPLLFRDDSRLLEAAKKISEKGIEAGSFFIKRGIKIRENERGQKRNFYFQVPCHERYYLGNEGNIFSFLRDSGILKGQEQVLGCCGFGGIFSLTNQGHSKRIFERNILERIDGEKGEKTILTTCSGCLYRLKKGLSSKKDISVRHLIEIFEKT